MLFSDAPLSTFALLMLPVVINLWAIYHAMRHNFPKDGERGLWVALAIFLPILGGLAYIIFGLRRSLPLGCGPIAPDEIQEDVQDNVQADVPCKVPSDLPNNFPENPANNTKHD